MAASHLTVSIDERTRLARTRLGELVLGKWRLDRLIGIGGMAAVFEATHRNGNRVAIKILHPDLAGFEEIRERFTALLDRLAGQLGDTVRTPETSTELDAGNDVGSEGGAS
jgi:serine/threonine protein kinase